MLAARRESLRVALPARISAGHKWYKSFMNDTEQEAIETLNAALARLDVDTVIADDLERLFEISFDPHRVILHFELSTVEKFDKLPGEVIYEFSPRGEALNRLWKEYEANTNEPYLNNAKSVYSLD